MAAVNDLERFVMEYNATRNATFIMFGALLSHLASEKGPENVAWLKQLRDETLGELDAIKMQNPSDEKEARTAEIAEISRATIGAIFDLSIHRQSR